jgi:ABC-type oligopeptide transport system ATPase subunit|tara:strand:- start:3725 stop:3928 length:204 start_codon:yes stop_codon:yes gene_type:complete
MTKESAILKSSLDKRIKSKVIKLANDLGKKNNYKYADFSIRLEAAYYHILAIEKLNILIISLLFVYN